MRLPAEGAARPTGRLRVPDTVLFEEVSGEVVLLDLASGKYYGLNGVASRMWHALVQAGDVEAAVPLLQARYDVPVERLRADLARLVGRLLAAGLLEGTDGA